MPFHILNSVYLYYIILDAVIIFLFDASGMSQ